MPGRVLSTVLGTQQVLTDTTSCVLLVSDPSHPAASSPASSDWALLRTRAPSSGGCCLYSHLRPLQKDLGSFLPAPPLPLKGKGRRRGGGNCFTFPRHFLCLLPGPWRAWGLRSGGRKRCWEVGGSWLHDSWIASSHLLILSRAALLCGTPRATSREDTRQREGSASRVSRAIMR